MKTTITNHLLVSDIDFRSYLLLSTMHLKHSLVNTKKLEANMPECAQELSFHPLADLFPLSEQGRSILNS